MTYLKDKYFASYYCFNGLIIINYKMRASFERCIDEGFLICVIKSWRSSTRVFWGLIPLWLTLWAIERHGELCSNYLVNYSDCSDYKLGVVVYQD